MSKTIELKAKEDFDYSQKLAQSEQYILNKIKDIEFNFDVVEQLVKTEENALEYALLDSKYGVLRALRDVYSDMYFYLHEGSWDEIESEYDIETTSSECSVESKSDDNC